MSDPKAHATRRRQLAQGFSNSNLQAMELSIREQVKTAISKIKRDALAGNADVMKWFTFMATDISGEASFGKSFEMIQQEQVRSMYIICLDSHAEEQYRTDTARKCHTSTTSNLHS